MPLIAYVPLFAPVESRLTSLAPQAPSNGLAREGHVPSQNLGAMMGVQSVVFFTTIEIVTCTIESLQNNVH